MKRVRSVFAASFAFLLVTGVEPPRAGAQELPGTEPPPLSEIDDDPGPSDRTPPRLSHIDGKASFWRDGAEAWSEARINTPLAPGDQLYVDNASNLELQIGPRDFVRVASNSQLAFDSDESDYRQFRLTNGRAALDLRALRAGETVELDTPHGAFTIQHNGYYRTEVDADATHFVARRGGRATVTAADGEPQEIVSNEQVVLRGDGLESVAASEPDAWDRWNNDRSDGLVEAVSYRHVPEAVYGVDDLDHNGRWRVVPDYGSVWFPTAVSSSWAPYTTGRWVLDPYYGWTWIDDAPWGWAPFHYGRWVHVDRFWGWAPGPIVARPYYAPALVAFFSAGPVTVGVSLGRAPLLGWTPLGWGEPCRPWWGHTRYAGRPHWFGWGGPRVTINQTIHNDVHVYRNGRVRNGVVVMDRDRFGRGPVAHGRVASGDWSRLREVRGALPVRSDPARVVGGAERGRRPPDSMLERRVVATRAAGAPSARGSFRRSDAPPNPPAQLVPTPREARARGAVQRPRPSEQASVERRVRPSPRFQSVRSGQSSDPRENASRLATRAPHDATARATGKSRGAPHVAQAPAPRPPTALRAAPNGFDRNRTPRAESRRPQRIEAPRVEARATPSPRIASPRSARQPEVRRSQPRLEASRGEARVMPSPRIAPAPEVRRSQGRPPRVASPMPDSRADRTPQDRSAPRIHSQNAPRSAANPPAINRRNDAASRDARRRVVADANGAPPNAIVIENGSRGRGQKR